MYSILADILDSGPFSIPFLFPSVPFLPMMTIVTPLVKTATKPLRLL